jgi:uncharacterized protein YgiM (DUF1202 family)
MKSNTWLALILSLTLACFCSSARAQSTNEAPPVPDSAKPKAPSKAVKKSTKKDSAKPKKKDEAKKQDAQPLTPGPAIVKEKNVNVRGQAAINSEVVAHLKRGDHVQVLEEVTLKSPKTDEPAKWAKIALPTNAPVWVNASFLDANKSVVPKKLNLRSGPGENFSVIGRIPKGTSVKEIESKGDWIRIEAPGETYAFVAAHLISNDAAGAPVLASTDVPKPPPVPAPGPAPAPVPAPPIETAVATAKPPVVGAEPAGPTPAPVVSVAPAPTPPVAPSPVVAPPVRPEPPDEDVKRIVTREGFVKRSVSIQAPTYFVLENLSNGKTINYLFSTNLVLKDFKGKRVLVTGEEMLDERWPNIPVITIDKLEAVEAAP